MRNTEFLVYETSCTAQQEGDRYIHVLDASELTGHFETMWDAVAFVDSVALDEPMIYPKSRGLDEVAYTTLEVYEVTVGDDDSQEDSQLVYSRSSLTSSWNDAMRSYESDYWAFLDFEADGYGPLCMYL